MEVPLAEKGKLSTEQSREDQESISEHLVLGLCILAQMALNSISKWF